MTDSIIKFFTTEVSLGINRTTPLSLIVWALMIGFIVAIIVTVANKLVIGSLVRALLDSGANSPETAKSARELGKTNIFLKFFLRPKGTLRNTVTVCKVKVKTDRLSRPLYIKDENRHKAESIYSKKGVNPVTVILAIIAVVAVFAFALKAIPALTEAVVGTAHSVTADDTENAV